MKKIKYNKNATPVVEQSSLRGEARYTLRVTRNKGFTLIELLIYIGILAVVLLMVTNILITTSYFSLEEGARLEINKNGRFAVERIIRDLQTAENITSASGSNLNLDSGQTIYSLQNEVIKRQDVTSAESVTDNQVKITSLEFTEIKNVGGKPTIKINLTVDYIGKIEGNRDISQDFKTTYSLK